MNTTNNHPLRLATGSHSAGSGKGCAMNVISWESGDTTITDLPVCADRMLARVVQRVNDTICTHRDGDLLCPSCSVSVLDLAHRTVGTGGTPDLERHRVWVQLAVDEARSVLHLNGPRALRAIEAAERWVAEPTAANAAHAAAAVAVAAAANAVAAANAAYAAAHAAANAAAYAANAAANAAHAAYAVAVANANAAANAAVAAAAATDRLAQAHALIDRFNALTGRTEQPVAPEVTAGAVTKMLAVAP